MAEETDIVVEFIKEFLPKDLVEAAQLLVSLKYPIPDKKSLVLQLEQRKTENPQGNVVDSDLSRSMLKLIEKVTDTFKPEDFGLDTPQSALEKFFAGPGHYRPFPSFPRRRLPSLPDLPPSVPEPPAYSNPFFGPGPCGEAAAQLWREHLHSRITRWVGPNEEYYFFLQAQAETCRRR